MLTKQNRMTQTKKPLSKSWIVLGLFICLAVLGFIVSRKSENNFFTSDLAQFNNAISDYRIYYVSGNTLYSNSPNATDKRQVTSLDNEKIIDYFMGDIDEKKVIVAGEAGVYEVHPNKTRLKIIDFPSGYTFKSWQFSPNKKFLTALINREITENGIWSQQQIGYFIEIPTHKVTKIFDNSTIRQKEELKYMLWHSDNQRIFLITTNVYSPNDVKEEYSDYNIGTGYKNLLGSQDALRKPLRESEFAKEDIWKFQTPSTLLAKSVERSQDGQIVQLEEGFLLINGQRTIPICHYSKYYNHQECSDPQWSPDNQRIYIEGFSNDEIRVVEVKTKKYAKYDDGHNLKLFDTIVSY